jgi:CheY-like chemotaxis protein
MGEIMPLGKILIADDEKEIRDLFVDSLQPHGYAVLSAQDGHAAVEMVQNEKISVAFLDIRMPGMNGVEALLKIVEVSPETQVVMITGHYEDGTVEEALRRGSFLCLMKPFRSRDVLSLLMAMDVGPGAPDITNQDGQAA